MKSRLLLGFALASVCALVGAVGSAAADDPTSDSTGLDADSQLLAAGAPIQLIDGVWQIVNADAASSNSANWTFSSDGKVAGHCAGQANPPTKNSGNVAGQGVAACTGDVAQQYMQVCVLKYGNPIK